MNTAVVAKVDQPESVALISMIGRAAADPNVDIEKMERLLSMQERILDRNAKAAYAAALSRLQPKLPMITERGGIKDRAGKVQSRYALWEDIVAIITPILAVEGFSLSFRTTSDTGSVTVTGVLLHSDGHSEQTSLTLPMDTSGSKNNVQGVGSSTSYGKRYTAAALLNLRTGDLDDDGQAGGGDATVSEEQIVTINEMLEAGEIDKRSFCQYLKVDSVSEILAKNFETVLQTIRQRNARRK